MVLEKTSITISQNVLLCMIALCGACFLLRGSEQIQTPKSVFITTSTETAPNLKGSSHSYRLPSGWDKFALDLFQDTSSKLSDESLKSDTMISTVKTYPLDDVRYMNVNFMSHPGASFSSGEWAKNELSGEPKWERETFKTFLTYLPASRFYVDFGTWVGVTLLFAAQVCEKSLGIEADPVAYSVANFNLMLNRKNTWSSKVFIQPGGVGLGDYDETPVRTTMQSANAGNSCSGFGEIACGDAKTKWKVNTYPLPFLLAHYEIPLSSDTLIKVDVESFECSLVPSWLDLFEKLDSKPTMYISFHPQITKCTEADYAAIVQFAQLYRYVSAPFLVDGVWDSALHEILFSDLI